MLSNLNSLKTHINPGLECILVVVRANDENTLMAVRKLHGFAKLNVVLFEDNTELKEQFVHSDLPENTIVSKNTSLHDLMLWVEEITQKKGRVVLMKGRISTAELMSWVIKRKYGLIQTKLLSHFALFELPNYHKLLGITDSAMNISPGSDKKIKIIQNTVAVLHKLGYSKPKIACLSALEYVNPKISATTDAEEIVHYYKDNKLCTVDGPFALDIAVSRKAADLKNIHSEVAGDSDVLLLPEINAGNILYKSLRYFGNGNCAGMIIGAKIPLVITSRSDSVENKYYSILLSLATL